LGGSDKAINIKGYERVADKLPRTMIGDVAAAIHPIYLYSALFKLRFTPKQVSSLPSPPKGEGVGVFKQQQGGGDLSSSDLIRKLNL
jgi:hypothetical protein